MLISLLVSGTFSCSGQTNCEITFFPLLFNLSPVFPRGRRSQYLPSWSSPSEEASAQTCTPAARGWWVWVFSEIHLLRVPFGKRLNNLLSPSKLCKNHLPTQAALEMDRGFSHPGEHRRGRETCREGQHLSDVCPGFHHHNQGSFTGVGSGWDMHWIPPPAHHHSSQRFILSFLAQGGAQRLRLVNMILSFVWHWWETCWICSVQLCGSGNDSTPKPAQLQAQGDVLHKHRLSEVTVNQKPKELRLIRLNWMQMEFGIYFQYYFQSTLK